MKNNCILDTSISGSLISPGKFNSDLNGSDNSSISSKIKKHFFNSDLITFRSFIFFDLFSNKAFKLLAVVTKFDLYLIYSDKVSGESLSNFMTEVCTPK